jgi:uncharacterized membrane-anchored protein
MKQFARVATGTALFAAPFMALAAGTELGDIFEKLGDLVQTLTPVIVAIALLAFFWGLAMYVLSFSGDDKEKKKGRDMMIYGVIVLFVMVSVWGLVQVLQNTFDIDTETNQEVPSVDLG